jgi:KaiC/GvpD/RAD55 family RecA-like ATPase
VIKLNFIGELKGIIDDPKFGYDEEQFMIKTGFTTLDYLNGNVVVKDDGSKKYNLGVDAGKIITIIGKTGAGKSTLAIQIGTNIIRKYDQGSMFILDFEQSNGRDRVRAITGMSEEEFDRRIAIKKIGISTETVLQIVSQIKQLKLKYKKELLVDNAEGIIDPETGKLKKILPPTVVLVDSVAMMMPAESLESEEIKGQMAATAMAKANTQLDT